MHPSPIDDLGQLKGISTERLEQIRAQVTVVTLETADSALEPTGRPTARPPK